MLICLLAQTKQKLIAPEEQSQIYMYLMIVLLGIGILMVVGLIGAWRNHLRRQRDIEQEHEDRDSDQPRPDAWATAAQRLEPEDVSPDEAHVSGYDEEDQPDAYDPEGDQGEDEDDDDFPFRDPDDNDDDDGPIGRS